MSIEQPLSAVENPEKRRYEYKDASGKKIADVEAELESGGMIEDPETGDVTTAKRLSKLVLTNPEDGRTFDVLAAFNRHGAGIVVPEARGARYSHDEMSNEVVVPSPESPVDLATMLHELGHIDQLEDEESRDLFSRAPLHKFALTEAPVSAYVKWVRENGGGHQVSDEEAAKFFRNQFATLERLLPEAAASADRAAVEALSTATDLERLNAAAVALRDVLALPLRMSERDATRRALQDLRRIREEAGIDLLSKTLNPKKALASEAEGCEAATVDGVEDPDAYVKVSTVAAMKGDLKTYGAGKFRIKR